MLAPSLAPRRWPRPGLFCLALALAPAAQVPRVLATYKWNGEERTVTSDDVALEMAPRHRRTARGEETLNHLIDLHIVRSAAEQKNLLPTDADVQKQVAAFRDAIKAQGRDPDKFLQGKGVTAGELADYTVLTLALDRLVMQQLGLQTAAAVTNEYRELWLADARKAAGIVTDENSLPDGVLARTGDRQFTLLDLGRTLVARTTASERARFAKQVVLRRALDDMAREQNIAVTDADREAAVALVRERAEDSTSGVAFGSVLEAFGTTPTELMQSPVIRAQVIARKLLAARWSEAALRERLAQDGDALRARHGARRRVEVLWLRATDTPNQLMPRTFAAAHEEAGKLRARLGEGTPFAILARKHSDDPGTKLKGGDSGWHHRAGKGLPAEVLAWAFAAARGDVSEPLRVADGVCLVRVADVEAEPTLQVLRARLLDAEEERFYRELLEKVDLELREGA